MLIEPDTQTEKMMPQEKKKIRYDISFDANPDGFTEQEIAEYGDGPDPGGGCDAFIFHSILFQEGANGPARSEEIITVDGRNGSEPMSTQDFIASWGAMTMGLSQNPDLSAEQQKFFDSMGDLYLQRFHPDVWAKRTSEVIYPNTQLN